MKNSRRMIIYFLEIAIGIGLIVAGQFGVVDEYWSGLGTGLIFVAVLMLFKQIRYQKNDTYRQAVDVEISDERNRFIRTKAWAWAGYGFIIISAFASIILKVFGREDVALIASYGVCAILVLYWVSYWILKKKY